MIPLFSKTYCLITSFQKKRDRQGRRKGQKLTVGLILCIIIKALTYWVLSCVRYNYVSRSLCQSSQASCVIGLIISKLQTGKQGFREVKQLTQITQLVSGKLVTWTHTHTSSNSIVSSKAKKPHTARMATNSTDNNMCWQGLEKLELSYIAGGEDVKWCSHSEKQCGSSSNS